jgi:glycosyltransferase involved in cell wall biosynthesis
VSHIPLSVVVPTLNETRNIEECLAALSAFDQVVVVDSASADDTQSKAKDAGAEVVEFRWNHQYPKKKQWALDTLDLRHDWVLFVDGDETPSPALVDELRDVFSDPGRLGPYGAFDIDLDYTWCGRTLKHGHRVTKRALVHRARAHFPELDDLDAPGMGEQEGHYQPTTDYAVGHLRHRIEHDDHDPLSSWFQRHNRYSDWEAYLRTTPGVRQAVAGLRTRQGRLFDRVPFKPLVFFVHCFIARRGFLDGRRGFDYATALAFYYWQISLKTREQERRAAPAHAPLVGTQR